MVSETSNRASPGLSVGIHCRLAARGSVGLTQCSHCLQCSLPRTDTLCHNATNLKFSPKYYADFRTPTESKFGHDAMQPDALGHQEGDSFPICRSTKQQVLQHNRVVTFPANMHPALFPLPSDREVALEAGTPCIFTWALHEIPLYS